MILILAIITSGYANIKCFIHNKSKDAIQIYKCSNYLLLFNFAFIFGFFQISDGIENLIYSILLISQVSCFINKAILYLHYQESISTLPINFTRIRKL